MKRREFISLLGRAAAGWPLAAHAQSERVRRIGVLMPFAADGLDLPTRIAAFLNAMQQLGWDDGRNLRIDHRWSAGDIELASKYAAELIALAPDVILGSGNSTVTPLARMTRTVPIVFVQVADPVGAGLVASLARPGGNVTGFTPFEFGLSGKWLQLLKEMAPRVTRAAVLRDSSDTAGIGQWGAVQAVAPLFGVELTAVGMSDPGEIERSVAALAREPNGALIVTGSGPTAVHRDLIITLAARHRLPAVYPFRYFATQGGLVSYGPELGRTLPPRRRIRRSHPQGREAGRPAGAGADQVRTGDQP